MRTGVLSRIAEHFASRPSLALRGFCPSSRRVDDISQAQRGGLEFLCRFGLRSRQRFSPKHLQRNWYKDVRSPSVARQATTSVASGPHSWPWRALRDADRYDPAGFAHGAGSR